MEFGVTIKHISESMTSKTRTIHPSKVSPQNKMPEIFPCSATSFLSVWEDKSRREHEFYPSILARQVEEGAKISPNRFSSLLPLVEIT